MEKKEVENYVINSSVIKRFIDKRTTKGRFPKKETVEKKLDEICENLKDYIVDQVGEKELDWNRGLGLAGAMKKARARVQACWGELESKLAVSPGKRVVSEMSKWAQRNYGVSFGAVSLAREFYVSEIENEMREILLLIEKSKEKPS